MDARVHVTNLDIDYGVNIHRIYAFQKSTNTVGTQWRNFGLRQKTVVWNCEELLQTSLETLRGDFGGRFEGAASL